MKTISTEIAHYYTLIVEQENDSTVAHCRVLVTGSNRIVKDRIDFDGNNFDAHVKWANGCIEAYERSLIASRAFNLN